LIVTEEHFIPFQTSQLPQGPWLIFAPHSDDETFGMGGAMLLAQQQNIPIYLIVLTDGALGGKQNNLVNIRQQETINIATQLNIANTEFWQYPDRGLIQDKSLITKIIQKIEHYHPHSIFFPAISEYHPDHRMTAFLVWQAIQHSHYSKNIFSYEIGSQQQPVNLLLDITEVFKDKQKLMKIYQSQLSENNYDDIITAINRSRTYTLSSKCQYAEAFYQFSYTDTLFLEKGELHYIK
jgi:LmbE family N-acetylglucosaminyl deacetylase